MSRRLSGSCLCRRVGYDVEDAFEYAFNCHCGNCRRATGAAFKPFAGIRLGKLTLRADATAVLRYGDGPAHDVHCAVCGSLLYSVVRDGAYAHVTLGTLEDDPSIRPSAHLFVGSKAPWHEIRDALPQHEAFP